MWLVLNMKIINKTESKERCVEAGWFAFQYYLEKNISREDILSLRPLGSFLFMDKLAQPFFKIESDHYMIKGLLNDISIRIALHKDYFDELERIETFIMKGEEMNV